MPILANVIQDAFSPLITLFEAVMVFIHNNLTGGSWGLAIVGLTVVIRAVLVPLTFRQLKSMQEMQRLAPQISALKEKYKEDKQRQQQELMKFYQENKINPLASCLPLLLQLPVFISLFYMLRTDLKKHICGKALEQHYVVHHKAGESLSKFIEHVNCETVQPHSAKFLFLPDITNKATGAALVVLIVLYVGSQLASTLIATATADPNQRRLMLLLPIVFVVILYRYPAGLLVYWITTNLWTIGQQYLIRRHMPPPPKPEAPADAANGKPRTSLRAALAGVAAGDSAQQTQPEASAGARPATSTPPRPPRKKKKRSGRRR
jgi:YidC/Oxa1 family membrane protein insertase